MNEFIKLLYLVNVFKCVICSDGDIISPFIGYSMDNHNCLISAGYSWCESSQNCIRQWETPCDDNYNNCNDCLSRQGKGENIACPIECDLITINCNTDKDCLDNYFCRPTTIDINGKKKCVKYSKEGESCGYILPNLENKCGLSLECVHIMGSMIADVSDQCMRPCDLESIRDNYGNCIKSDNIPHIMEPMDPLDPGLVLTSTGHDFPTPDGLSPIGGINPSCNICPPPVPCPMPAPGCNFMPSEPDECGCIIGCGNVNCNMNPFEHICSDIMCEMYCEYGNQIDQNGCSICECNNGEMCSELQLAIYNQCNLSCDECDIEDSLIIIDECYINYNQKAKDNICLVNNCPLEQPLCDNYNYVCPKITEITHCSENGIDGYTTYQLSLVIKPNLNIENIYAIFGDGDGEDNGSNNMYIPGAYHTDGIFNSNIGGVSPSLISIYPDAKYDSWLTIGITDGDPNNLISTIGVDYQLWTESYPLNIGNGAIFLMDTQIVISNNNEYIIGQLTIRSDKRDVAIINVQGKIINNPDSWVDRNIIFNLNPLPIQNNIPLNCKLWYDGCNLCQVNNGILGSCSRIMCFLEGVPECRDYTSGH